MHQGEQGDAGLHAKAEANCGHVVQDNFHSKKPIWKRPIWKQHFDSPQNPTIFNFLSSLNGQMHFGVPLAILQWTL